MINNIEEAYQLITDYTSKTSRPGLSDLITFDILMDMYERDMSDLDPEYIWTDSPDNIMQNIIDNNELFTVDYGWEVMMDSIRDYLTDKDFIVHCDDLEEDEYQKLLEGRK